VRAHAACIRHPSARPLPLPSSIFLRCLHAAFRRRGVICQTSPLRLHRSVPEQGPVRSSAARAQRSPRSSAEATIGCMGGLVVS
jgi:hypothetical protein